VTATITRRPQGERRYYCVIKAGTAYIHRSAVHPHTAVPELYRNWDRMHCSGAAVALMHKPYLIRSFKTLAMHPQSRLRLISRSHLHSRSEYQLLCWLQTEQLHGSLSLGLRSDTAIAYKERSKVDPLNSQYVWCLKGTSEACTAGVTASSGSC
jgi:hypothetical protein